MHHAVLASLVGALVAAAPAAAAVRYVEPGGATSGSDCMPPDPPGFWQPCDLEYAVETVSQNGDEVIVAPGTYTGSVSEQNSVFIHGIAGAARPVVVGGLSISAPPGGTVRHLEIQGSLGVGGGGTVAEGLIVRGGAALGGTAVLRDSLVLSDSASQAAVQGASGSPQLRNVTVIATGQGSVGIAATTGGVCPDTVGLTAKNVIVRGERADLYASALCGLPGSHLAISHSNYRAGHVEGGGQVADGPGNQTNLEPLFKNPAAGDYHQLPTSPTIDAGTPDSLLGSSDFDGEARMLGDAPDIGADESPVRDRDVDGVLDGTDNCISVPNADQADHESDGSGDPCDPDDDNDGASDEADSCPLDPSADRRDTDGDGLGNPCDPDDDNDGVPDTAEATDGDDVLNGTPGADLICGLFGKDTINGLGGNDTLWGDACGKIARAGAAQARKDGNDRLFGGPGNDALYGAGGRDVLVGGRGRTSSSAAPATTPSTPATASATPWTAAPAGGTWPGWTAVTG